MNKTINIFEEASRKKLRFPYKGMITVEDLWDLNLEQLDSIYKTLYKEAEESNSYCLMNRVTDKDSQRATKIQIVTHIFEIKQEETEARKQAAANAAQRQLILGALARKREEAILGMSEEDLLKKLDELQ